MLRCSLFLLLLLLTPGIGSGIDVQAGPQDRPSGAVILVVDGLGSSYVYPEHSAYALDGSALGAAILFNLSGSGARAVDVRVPVPETTKSHAVLVTGSSGADPQSLGPNIFDSAREKGYLCIAILERGDSMKILQKQDAALYLGDNSLQGAEPIPGFRADVDVNLSAPLQAWRDRFAEYTKAEGTDGYAGYNAWALDAAADMVERLTGRRFLLLVNAGAVDSAGQNLGPEGYLETVQALDAPLGRLAETCRKNGVLLVVTADHGMSFPAAKGKGGHSAAKYAERLESLRVPLVISGPGVEELNLAGRWSETDIAPTVLDLLNISSNRSFEGCALPIKESFSLRVTGAPAGLALWRGEERLANGSADRQCSFQGLPRGIYTLKAGERSWKVLVNGDETVDLAGRAAVPGSTRKMLGVIVILAINLVGTVIIIGILRKG